MVSVIEDNLREQNKILKDALMFFYDHKLNYKTKMEVIVDSLDKVQKLDRKLKIKLIK